MKKLLSCFLFGSLFLLFPLQSFSEKYHGELCWQVFSSEQETLWKYKFGVYEKEGGHFVFYGSIDYGPNGPSASHGNAIVVGDAIKLTIVSTDYEDNDHVWNETLAVKLDRTTLNGTWHALSLESDDDSEEVLGFHSRGRINSIACE